MEYSQTSESKPLIAKYKVLILILMEYSQTTPELRSRCNRERLNPYSNGILTDKLSESELHFLPFIFSYSFFPFRQGVSPIRTLFSQM